MPINIIIPAAGAGSRFAKHGWKRPKPFIRANGLPLLDIVLNNMTISNSRKIIILQNSYAEFVPSLSAKYEDIIYVEGLTRGTACTVLAADTHLNADELVIVNSDQFLDTDLQAFIDDARKRNLDGSILVFQDNSLDPKWSFAKVGPDGLVKLVAEKKPISNLATVGMYYFRTGSLFKKYALQMIEAEDTHNDEFYTCPIYNYLIRDNLRVGTYEMCSQDMHGLGTPDDLVKYANRFNVDISYDAK